MYELVSALNKKSSLLPNLAYLPRLEASLSYQFQHEQFLKQALTHRSYNSQHNERFEFLGDALLETVISVLLFNRYPDLDEGSLTRLRASLVNRESLALIAKGLSLGEYLLLGAGERKSGGARRDSILSDALEAIFAAVYLDGGFAACEQVIKHLFAPQIDALPKEVTSLKDPKTQLQEYLQGRGLPLPCYQIIEQSGPEHNRLFEIAASSEDKRVISRANSRKKAEQQAASQLLEMYRLPNSY